MAVYYVLHVHLSDEIKATYLLYTAVKPRLILLFLIG